MADLLQTLIISLVLGSLYALIALGYTMVFGVLKLINFAHSDIVVLGAWTSIFSAAVLLPLMGVYTPEASWWALVFVLIVSMTTCGAIGYCIERFAYRPIRKAPRLNALITAIGVSLLLQNVGQLQFTIRDAKTATVATGHVAQRVAATKIKLDLPITIDTAGTFALRLTEREKPTSPPEDRPLALKPGTYDAGTELTLDRGIPGRFANADVSVLRTSMPIKFPFGARPASLAKGLLPADNAQLTAEQQAKTFLFRPSPAVLAQLNLYSTITAADGTAQRIYKPVRITVVDVIIVGTAIVLMLALQYLVFGTRVGTAMRAVSYNMDTAALMGIPVDRIVSFTFVTGTMLAAAAGFLYALKYAPIQQPAHTSWLLLGLKAFVAAVVGGIGNIRGAAVGGFLIAFIEQFSPYLASSVPQRFGMHGWDWVSSYTDVIVFGLLIVVLLVKPTGLFGSAIREKV